MVRVPRNVAEKLNRPSRVHECYRQTTDGRAIAYSEREREFTFAKNFRALVPVVLEIQMESPKTLYAYSRYSLSLGGKRGPICDP